MIVIQAHHRHRKRGTAGLPASLVWRRQLRRLGRAGRALGRITLSLCACNLQGLGAGGRPASQRLSWCRQASTPRAAGGSTASAAGRQLDCMPVRSYSTAGMLRGWEGGRTSVNRVRGGWQGAHHTTKAGPAECGSISQGRRGTRGGAGTYGWLAQAEKGRGEGEGWRRRNNQSRERMKGPRGGEMDGGRRCACWRVGTGLQGTGTQLGGAGGAQAPRSQRMGSARASARVGRLQTAACAGDSRGAAATAAAFLASLLLCCVRELLVDELA